MPPHLTAHDIAANPNLFFEIVTFGNSNIEWECMGYTKEGEGKTIKFARLLVLPEGKLRQINKYVNPKQRVYIVRDSL